MSMDQMPLLAVIFYSIPESVLLFSFGLTIVGEYINFKRVLVAAVISAFSSMFIRANVPFGIHSIIGVFILFVLTWKILKINPGKALISSLISLMTLLLLDTTILPIILKAKNTTIEEVLKDNYRRIIYPAPHLIIYGLITWFLYSRKIFLIKGSRVGNGDEYNKTRMLLTILILFQGLFLFVINEHLNYLGQCSFFIRLLSLIFFISSILFLNVLYGGDRLKKAQYRDKT